MSGEDALGRLRRIVALSIALGALSTPACDPISAGLVSIGAASTASTLVDGLDQAIDRMDQAIHDHRAALKTDVLEVVAKTREELERLLQDTHAVASALEERVAADLAGNLSVVIRFTEQITRDIEAAANDAVRNTAEQLRTTITQVQNGPMREAKATARILLAKGERTAQGIVVSIVSGASVMIFRLGAGLLLLIAAIGLIITAVKRSRTGLVATTVLALVAVGVIVFAPYVARIGAEKRTLPDPEASCDAALREGVKLERGLAAIARSRSSQTASKVTLPQSSPEGLRLIRGALELRAAAANRPLATGLPGAAVNRHLRLLLPAVAPGQRGSTRAQSWFGRSKRAGSPTAASPPSDPLYQGAVEVTEHGPVCVAFSMSPQKADACEKYVNEALAYLGVAVICTSASQCPAGQWCDEHTASCMELGTYCRRPDHCRTGTECDTSLNRCVSQSTFSCSASAKCRPGQLCRDGRCDDELRVVGQPCVDQSKQGPCTQGVLQKDGHGGVVCRSIVAAASEVCDGLDNNCNGTVDEGVLAVACTAQALGRCVQGRKTCRGGALICEPGEGAAERCNGVDDNCNGLVDDDPSCAPQTMVGGSIGCGWADANNATIGARCAGFARQSCVATSGPQSSRIGHAEFVDWESNDPADCRCKVHCGTSWRTRGERWTFEITARKRE